VITEEDFYWEIGPFNPEAISRGKPRGQELRRGINQSKPGYPQRNSLEGINMLVLSANRPQVKEVNFDYPHFSTKK